MKNDKNNQTKTHSKIDVEDKKRRELYKTEREKIAELMFNRFGNYRPTR